MAFNFLWPEQLIQGQSQSIIPFYT